MTMAMLCLNILSNLIAFDIKRIKAIGVGAGVYEYRLHGCAKG